MNHTIAQHTRKEIKNQYTKKVVKVVSVLVEPFVMIKRDCDKVNTTECLGNRRYEGYILIFKFII